MNDIACSQTCGRDRRCNQTLHSVDSNTTQDTNPDPHLHTAAPDTTTHTIICKNHTHAHEQTEHTCELYASTEHSMAWTVSQHNTPTLNHTYVLQRRTKRPTPSYARTTHTHAWKNRVCSCCNRRLHGVDIKTAKDTNPHPHLLTAAPHTRIRIVTCEKRGHTHIHA